MCDDTVMYVTSDSATQTWKHKKVTISVLEKQPKPYIQQNMIVL